MSATSRITPEELSRLMNTPGGPVVICLLPPEVHAAKRIPGSIPACVYEIVFPETVAGLVPQADTPIVVYGADAAPREAEVAAAKLAALGYSDVRILDGGITAWECAGLPLEGATPSAPLPDPAAQPPSPGRYGLVPSECSLEWVGRNKNGRHVGSVPVRSGRLDLTEDTLRGHIVLDAASIKDHDLADEGLNAMLTAHLLSDDFLAAALFPRAELHIDDALPIPGSAPGMATHHIHARLTLRGLTRPLSFPATLAGLPDGRLAAEAHFDLDRTQWGVEYGCGRLYRCLDYHLVYDLVSIAVRLTATPGVAGNAADG